MDTHYVSVYPVETEKPWLNWLKLRWQLAAQLGMHVLLMHLKRGASVEEISHWSLVARLLLRRGYPGLTQLESTDTDCNAQTKSHTVGTPSA